MPLYEYKCQNCGRQLEILRTLSDTSSPPCSACGSENLIRLVSRVSVIKSSHDRASDLSWVDKDLARRLKKKANAKLNPALKETLDRMESQ